MIKILTEATSLKDPALWEKIVPSGLNPDGYLNLESLNENLDWYVDRGVVRARPDMSAVVDNSFADYAIQKLGRYPRRLSARAGEDLRAPRGAGPCDGAPRRDGRQAIEAHEQHAEQEEDEQPAAGVGPGDRRRIARQGD